MIGVAGCGRCGAPMLEAFRDAGIDAQGFDPLALSVEGATSDAKAFAERLETLFVVERNDLETEELLFGAPDLIGAAPDLARIVFCSPLSLRYLHGLRARIDETILLIDAPVSGSVPATKARKLSFAIGGTETDVQDLLPILALVGDKFHHMGPFGAGMKAKTLNNLLLAANAAMTRVVLDMGEHFELDERQLLEMIHQSSGQNYFSSNVHELEAGRIGYEPENVLGRLVHSIGAALESAPADHDRVLPQAIMNSLRNLKPRG